MRFKIQLGAVAAACAGALLFSSTAHATEPFQPAGLSGSQVRSGGVSSVHIGRGFW